MDAIGGYRLVRKLGEGPRAEVHLGRLDAEADGEASVVVKHYRPGVDEAAISTEIEALARGVGEHTVALLDVTTAPSGQLALILARLSGGSLGRLLAHRSSLNTGEVVGILAPLAATVEALHAAGVVHGGIRLDAVLFDGSGTPVLACFGGAGLIQPGLPPALLDPQLGAEHDRRALGRGRAGCSRTRGRRRCGTTGTRLAGSSPQPMRLGPPSSGSRSGTSVQPHRSIFVLRPRRLRPRRSRRGFPCSPLLRRSGAPIFAAGPVGQVETSARPVSLRSATTFLDRAPGGAAVASSVLRSLGAVRLRVWVLAGACSLRLWCCRSGVRTGDGRGACRRRSPGTGRSPRRPLPAPAGRHSTKSPPRRWSGSWRHAMLCLRERSVLCLDARRAAGISSTCGGSGAGARAPDRVPRRRRRSSSSGRTSGSSRRSVAPCCSPWMAWPTRNPRRSSSPRAMRAGCCATIWSGERQIPSLPAKSPPSRRSLTATRKRAASAPSTMRWS